MMRRTLGLLAMTAICIAPSIALAAPAGAGSPPAPGSISPNHDTGQPGDDCVAVIDENQGAFPGSSSNAPGSAFNEDPGGTAGSVYAGEQAQNSKNTASVSQYDVACANQPL